MKKLIPFLSFFLLVGTASAQFDDLFAEPSFDDVNVGLSVLNISQDNVDATVSGARPGDVLRFEMTVSSPSTVDEFVPQADLRGLTGAAMLTDTGLGTVTGTDLVFPTITNAISGVDEKYVFFARVNEGCGGETALVSQAADGPSVMVPLENCDHMGGEGACYGENGCGDNLSATGPNTVVALLSLLGVFFLAGLWMQRRQS